MSKHLTLFLPLQGVTNLFAAEKSGLRCTAVGLGSGDICLYSPVLGLNEAVRTSLNGLGQITQLIAPNHYHNKGLEEYKRAFPEARINCSTSAEPRLKTQTGLSFEPFSTAQSAFPAHIRLLQPKGLKTGEVWIEVREDNQTIWIVADAFCGAKGPPGAVVASPSLLGTFPRFGIANRGTYRDWLAEEISQKPPTTIIPCHGSIIRGHDIASKAIELIDGLE